MIIEQLLDTIVLSSLTIVNITVYYIIYYGHFTAVYTRVITVMYYSIIYYSKY